MDPAYVAPEAWDSGQGGRILSRGCCEKVLCPCGLKQQKCTVWHLCQESETHACLGALGRFLPASPAFTRMSTVVASPPMSGFPSHWPPPWLCVPVSSHGLLKDTSHRT